MKDNGMTAANHGLSAAAAGKSREVEQEQPADWLWFGYDENDRPYISFGRWRESSCQHGYVLTEREDFNGYQSEPPE